MFRFHARLRELSCGSLVGRWHAREAAHAARTSHAWPSDELVRRVVLGIHGRALT
jgi:hypothetical protein